MLRPRSVNGVLKLREKKLTGKKYAGSLGHCCVPLPMRGPEVASQSYSLSEGPSGWAWQELTLGPEPSVEGGVQKAGEYWGCVWGLGGVEEGRVKPGDRHLWTRRGI